MEHIVMPVAELEKSKGFECEINQIDDLKGKIAREAKNLEAGMLRYYDLEDKLKKNSFRYATLFGKKVTTIERLKIIKKIYKSISDEIKKSENRKSSAEIISMIDKKHRKEINKLKKEINEQLKDYENEEKENNLDDDSTGIELSRGNIDHEEIKQIIIREAEAARIIRKIYFCIHEDRYAGTEDENVRKRYEEKKQNITNVMKSVEMIKASKPCSPHQIQELNILLIASQAIEAYILGEAEEKTHCDEVERLRKRLRDIMNSNQFIQKKVKELEQNKFTQLNLFDENEVERINKEFEQRISKKYDKIISYVQLLKKQLGSEETKIIINRIEAILK